MADAIDPLTRRVIGHGLLVLLVGLVGGVLLVFSLLGVVQLWPLPALEAQVPGSVRGWQAAHVGGILNGVMIAVLALVAAKLSLTQRSRTWVAWGLIYTGWGNTVFYWAGNFSANRGLSAGTTPYGPGDIMGVLAYVGGGSAMFATFALVILMLRAAFRS